MLILSAGMFCGCSGGSDGENFTLQESVESLFTGKDPNQLVNQAFYSPDPDMQRQAIDELVKDPAGLAEPYLKGYASLLKYQLKLKNDGRHQTLISSTVRALGKAGDTTYAPDVLAASKDENPVVRADVAVALGNLKTDPAFGVLRKMAVSDHDTQVRMNACNSLANFYRPESVHTLTEAMRDEDFAVRFQANQSLVKLTGKDMGPNAADWAGVKLPETQPTTRPEKPWWKFW